MKAKWIVSVFVGAALCGPAWARVFNSTIKLKVYARGSGDVPDRFLGFTPSRRGHPVNIPPGTLWYVRPMGALSAIQLERLAGLFKTEKIPGLDLSDHWELTNQSLSHLRSVTHLAMLDLSRTKITDAGLHFLQACRSLTVLILPDQVSDKGLEKLVGLKKLRELNLDQTRVTDQGVSLLTKFPELENLDLSSTHMTDAGLAHLTHLPRLRRLVLNPLITDASAAHLGKLARLREIDISQTQVGEPALAALGLLPELETLYVGKQMTDAGLQALSKSPSLRALDLTRTEITDAGVKHLARVKTLQEVALSQTKVGNACLPYLAQLPELRMIELSDTQVTSDGLYPLAALKKLEVLSLSWRTLSREDLQGMAKLKQLKTIVLNGVPLPESTMVQLRQLGTPSPWDSIVGLERARLRETKKTGAVALSAPVPTPSAAASTGALPELAKPSIAPSRLPQAALPKGSQGRSDAPGSKWNVFGKGTKKPAGPQPVIPPVRTPEQIASLPTSPERIHFKGAASPKSSLEDGASLKNAQRTPSPLSLAPPRKSDEVLDDDTAIGAAPARVVVKGQKEDDLLKAITLQSNPTRAGAFAGLSGMRQLRQTETLAQLNRIVPASPTAAIPRDEDKPENSLGEITVGVEPSR